MAGYSFIRKYGFQIINCETAFQRLNFPCRQAHFNPSNAYFNFPKRKLRISCGLAAADKVYSIFFRQFSLDAKISSAHNLGKEVESPFQTMLHLRQKQAQQSVLIELLVKNDVPHACAYCQKFGNIENSFTYSGESDNVYLLIEFSDSESVKNILSDCQCSNISDSFPIFSRLIRYEKKNDQDLSQVEVNVIEDTDFHSSVSKPESVSQLIHNIYSSEKLSELNLRLRYLFCVLLKDSVSGLFPYCEVLPFGSSVNGLGKHGCDLDVILRLYPEKIESNSELLFVNKICVGNERTLQQRAVFCLGDFFRTFLPGISSLQKIIHARVPIMKIKHRILNMDCDVSVNNMSAILMSELIYFYGEIDFRVRPLIYAVKKWAKEANVTYEHPGSWITNFGLTLLVLFFLQNRSKPILPPFNDVIHVLGNESTELKVVYMKSVSDLKDAACLNKENLAVLLQEFLLFLGTYPFSESRISLLTGCGIPKSVDGAIWVEYPMDEQLNVTKNVSQHEMWDLREKALASSRYLLTNMNNKFSHNRDFTLLLGIPSIKKLDFKKAGKLDVGSLLTDNHMKNTKKKNIKKQAL